MNAEELKAKAASRYQGTLKKVLLEQNPFPVFIPYARLPRSGDPAALLQLKRFLRSESKAENGFGPTIHFEQARTQKFGSGLLAGDIKFDSLDDLTRYIGKKAEADRILAHAQIILEEFPIAREWISRRLSRIAEGDPSLWHGIVKAVIYFCQNQKPWIYPREVPLGLHTKFLEMNYSSIIELLSVVSPTSLNESYTSWQDRLGLRSASEMIEGRFLDAALVPQLPRHMLAPVQEWNRCAFDSPVWVLITENRTTLLTLPQLRGCVALLGKGYAVNRLAQIDKLASCTVFYWGDIDQHGFEILASLRSRLPNIKSCLMDEGILGRCSNEARDEQVDATLPGEFVATNLNEDERRLWQKCTTTHLRLEQENIPCQCSKGILEQLALSI